jgi:hypothetical protein
VAFWNAARFRIVFVEEVFYFFADLNEVFVAFDRWATFVEWIAAVVVGCSKEFFLFFKERFPEFKEEWIERVELSGGCKATPFMLGDCDIGVWVFFSECAWDVTREALLDRCHAKGTLLVEDLATKEDVRVDPRFTEGAFGGFDIGHPLPRLVDGFYKEGTRFDVSETVLEEGVVPDGIETHGGEWHVDALHGHEIDFTLPALPVPESCCVGNCAIVEVDSVLVWGANRDGLTYFRQNFWELELVATP